MSLKVHLLVFHLDFFVENRGRVSDEHSKRFYQGCSTIKEHYQDFWKDSMLTDCCWTLYRSQLAQEHRRKSQSNSVVLQYSAFYDQILCVFTLSRIIVDT